MHMVTVTVSFKSTCVCGVMGKSVNGSKNDEHIHGFEMINIQSCYHHQFYH